MQLKSLIIFVERKAGGDEMKPIKQGKYLLQFDPPEFIQLKIEVSRHPELIGKLLFLRTQGKVEFADQLAEIATHCGILIDGVYTEKQLAVICEALIADLRQKRTGIITSH